MRYTVFFTNGDRLSISKLRYQNILENLPVETQRFFEGDWPYIEMALVTHILPEGEIDEESGVVKAPSPAEAKVAAEKEKDRIVRNSSEIVSRIQKRESENELS